MSRIIYILLFCMTLVFAGCEKDLEDDATSGISNISYGYSFGECVGYCSKSIAINNSEIQFLKSGWAYDSEYPAVNCATGISSNDWNELVDKVNYYSFISLESVIGCPDCADGGAEWIEIINEGSVYKVTFEYRNEPLEISILAAYLRNYSEQFSVCD